VTATDWHAAYYSALQTVWAPLVVPLAFLAWRLAARAPLARAVVPGAARFVSIATVVFALETLLDPIATGPLLKTGALRDGVVATVVPFVFVYLGDLRVLVIALAVAAPALSLGALLGHAGAVALIVPIAAGGTYAALRALVPALPGQALWMLYEAGFLALCVVAARVWLPRLDAPPGSSSSRTPIGTAGRAFLEALFGYSAAYYAVWLAADVLIVGGLDVGWAIRMLPNQLYYAFWVPFVYFRFFSAPAPVPAAVGANAAR